jgi:hypothetical protein
MPPALRTALKVSLVLTTLGFVQLYVFAADTGRFFAWTIDLPLTAAFLGSGFGAGVVLVWGVLRRDDLAAARLGLWTVMAFVVVMTLATFLHIDRFHLSDDLASARLAAWLWTAVYVITPIVGLTLLLRLPPNPPDPNPLPLPIGLRILLAVIGAALVTGGLWLEVGATSTGWWPWQPVSPLSARAIAAWLLSIGPAALAVATVNNLHRVGATPAAFAGFGLLTAGALARYPQAVVWSAPATWVYVTLLVGSIAAGIAGMRLLRTAR